MRWKNQRSRQALTFPLHMQPSPPSDSPQFFFYFYFYFPNLCVFLSVKKQETGESGLKASFFTLFLFQLRAPITINLETPSRVLASLVAAAAVVGSLQKKKKKVSFPLMLVPVRFFDSPSLWALCLFLFNVNCFLLPLLLWWGFVAFLYAFLGSAPFH